MGHTEGWALHIMLSHNSPMTSCVGIAVPLGDEDMSICGVAAEWQSCRVSVQLEFLSYLPPEYRGSSPYENRPGTGLSPCFRPYALLDLVVGRV